MGHYNFTAKISLENWPCTSCLAVKPSLLGSRADVPYDDSLGVFWVVLKNTECDHVPLTWGEINKLDPSMAESHDLRELGTSPQSNTLLVESGEIGALW